MSLFRTHLLPAGHGDCIVVEYGSPAQPHRILIDGGTEGTWKRLKKFIEALPKAARKFELLVVTHIDADHIGGALGILDGSVEGLEFADIWFNGWRHLTALEEQGPVQGEKLTTLLWPQLARWNKAFGGKAVVLPETGPLPTVTLPGGMRLTLLSPTPAKLRALQPEWKKKCEEAGLAPQVAPPVHPEGLEPMGAIDIDALAAEPFKEDPEEANGSSIAFLAEYGGKKILFAADAHPSVLVDSIGRLPGGKLQVDAFKLPHHGSKKNVSTELLSLVQTNRYLFSTNGSYFKHPSREAVARVIQRRVPSCELRFNYRSDYTRVWDSAALSKKWGFFTSYPASDDVGDVFEL